MEAIRLDEVTKDYGDVRALDGVDLVIRTGTVTAILGPNGAGKTTAVELMLGLRRATSGRVTILGGAPGRVEVRSRVGAMLQDPGFPEATTVCEVLALVAAAYPEPAPLAEVVATAGMAGLENRRIAQLSGGQRQRLAFGIAIVGNPDVVFLDEPTVALDISARRTFWAHVHDLADRGHTVVFTTHQLGEADNAADRIVVIDRGRIRADGSPDEVKRLVDGRTITITTERSTAALLRLPGVDGVDRPDPGPGDPDGTRPTVVLHTTDVDAVLRALVASGQSLADLTASRASLEEAVLRLTATP